MRRGIMTGLAHGKSFAILGGRRCGKTSLLLQLEKDLRGEHGGSFNFQPRFLDIQALGRVTPEKLFKAIFKLIAPGVRIQPPYAPGEEYDCFLAQLDETQEELRRRHGSDWLLVLLVDELDSAIASLPDDHFFQNLRNLLMVSSYHRHFRLVATGVKEMGRLISSGSSPLNNLSHIYLRPLEKQERMDLVRKGYPDGLPEPVVFQLESLCGGHPYLWQGLLEKLEEIGDLSCAPVDLAAQHFLREHKDFRRWLDGFSATEKEVYRTLALSPASAASIQSLQQQLPAAMTIDVEDSITPLGFHCLIDESNPDLPVVSGNLFRNWFLQQTGATASPRAPAPTPTRRMLLDELFSTPAEPSTSHFLTQSILDLQPGDLLQERYEIRRLLGQGGNGLVFAAWDRNREKEIAVKILRPEGLADPQARERFLLEARLASDLTHPNIVNVHDVHRHGNDYFLTMELLDGKTLRQEMAGRFVSGRKFSAAEVIEMVRTLGQALAYAHRFAVHRDLKPENIFLPASGGIKIMDFGLARSLANQGITTAGAPLGTPYYMAPEQLRNEPVDGRADQYSIAVLAYELFTGELPMGMAPAVHLVRPDVSTAVSNAIARALSSKSAQRYATIQDFLAEWQDPANTLTPAHASNVVTIMFTDLIGSTEITEELGDSGAQEIVRAHNRIVREALLASQGAEIKHTGDGIMASFHSASSAVTAAVQIQRKIATLNAQPKARPWNVRIGLNAGEPIREEDDLFGATVQLASRACAAAAQGQILITSVVRALCSGKKFEIIPHGKITLKGFSEPVDLFEVRSSSGCV